jgi:hypothetical protein
MLSRLTRFIRWALSPEQAIDPESIDPVVLEEGQKAYLKHIWRPRGVNPYVPGTKSHRSWEIGFEDARRTDMQTW